MVGKESKKEPPRFRRMCVTMENYQKHGLDHDSICKIISGFKSLLYGCFDLEISTNGVPHSHAYLVFANQVRVTTVKNAFGDFVHIEKARGSHAQCLAYCEKSGESNADKKETQIEGSFWETGERPLDRSEKRESVWANVYELAKEGEMSALEILEEYPSLSNQLSKVEALVEKFKAQKSKRQWRKIEVIILYGATATGKTTWVYEQYGLENVYRVTDYDHPYDSYSGEETICYDEADFWADCMNLSTILQLTDKFPLGAALSRRYNNLVPEFDTCVFISNEDPNEFYPFAPAKKWNALLRRVSHIYRFDGIGKVVEEDKTNYIR